MADSEQDERRNTDGNRPDFYGLVGNDDILSPVFQYWSSKRRGPLLPSREDIEPAEITGLLPHVGLIDVAPNLKGFRYRLIGTHMVDMFGRDFTGTKIGNPLKDGAYGQFLGTFYSDAVLHRAPVYCESVFRYRGSGDLRIRRLIMPLTATLGSNAITMLFFSNTFYRSLERDQVIYASTTEDGPFLSENIESIDVLIQARGQPQAGVGAF